MTIRRRRPLALAVTFGLIATALTGSAVLRAADSKLQQKDTLGYQDTPMLPGGKWHVHDGFRPQPAVITPGSSSSQSVPGAPPSDAIVLFNGTPDSLEANWRMGDNSTPVWPVVDGAMITKKADLFTKQSFGDCQLHVEFRTPLEAKGHGQERSNSGVFLMSRYELQVLDNYDNQTYPDGQAGAIYGQHPPLVNACRKPGEWQTYDIVWTAPHFNADKTLASPAYETVLQNGVLVQNHTALIGGTGHRILGKYTFHNPEEPLSLQFNNNVTAFRNIWIRPLPAGE